MTGWLVPPGERAALVDVAKLAMALRGGVIPRQFLDGIEADVALGAVGRVTLLAPGDLGLAGGEHAARRFVLARGTVALCLAEVRAGEVDFDGVERFLHAVDEARQRHASGKAAIGWLLADGFDAPAAGRLDRAGAVRTAFGTRF